MTALIDMLVSIILDPWLLAAIFLVAAIIGFRESLRLPPDREAIESAISSAISQRCEVFVYGDERRPAQVFVEMDLTNDLHVEGFEDDA